MRRGYACIGLHHPKNSINVGAVLRATQCFGASSVVVSGIRYRRSSTDTMSAYKQLPLLHTDDIMSTIPFDCVPIAVELRAGAENLPNFKHPERAYYIFGPEDGSLPNKVMDRCRDVVAIPSGCLNLAAAVNIVLYDRTAKLQYRYDATKRQYL